MTSGTTDCPVFHRRQRSGQVQKTTSSQAPRARIQACFPSAFSTTEQDSPMLAAARCARSEYACSRYLGRTKRARLQAAIRPNPADFDQTMGVNDHPVCTTVCQVSKPSNLHATGGSTCHHPAADL
ncbi:unnamed protein product, partial [Ectocarpus fasciculatus]